MPMTQERIEECIKACWTCRHECQEVLFDHCLEQGGRHAEQEHVRLMADCIQICQTAADFMTRGSEMHAAVCAACAEVCDACADSCEDLDTEEMKACAETCRHCADLCREMGGGMKGMSPPEDLEAAQIM